MILDAAIARLTQVFAGRVLACYVVGSYADETAVPGSDVDLVFIFRDQVSDAEKQRVEDTYKALSHESGITIDLEILAEQDLKTYSDPVLKRGSRLLFGTDIRETLPDIDIVEWTRDRLHTSYWRSVKLFGRPPKTILPLSYPAIDDPFLGYIISGSTRTLLRHVSWAATALIAHQAQTVVIRKSDFYRVYRDAIGDEFSDYLERLYQKCKLEWNYQIPDNASDLRALCQQTLAFENHFMMIYRSFLIEELQSAHPTALWIQSQIPLMDAEIRAALERLANHSSAEVRTQASAALHVMNA